jgi:exodeoxyribonuclease VII large subunit
MTVKNGVCYFDLSDPESKNSYAPTINCVIWKESYSKIEAQLRANKVSINKGSVIKLRGVVKYFPGRSTIQFQIHELDVAGVIGEIALARLRLMEVLGKEGLITKNRSLPIPIVPLKIALIGSPGTQGFLDFMTQINASGFNFEVVDYPVPVQGSDAPLRIAAALAKLDESQHDITVIVRGGGSQSDLGAFDTEVVARAVANCKTPVFAGIGHTQDKSVVDEVASQSFITPTECGQQIVGIVKGYYEEIHEKLNFIFTCVNLKISDNDARLGKFRDRLIIEGRKTVDSTGYLLDLKRHKLHDGGKGLLAGIDSQVSSKANSLVNGSVAMVIKAESELKTKTHTIVLQSVNSVEGYKLRINNSKGSLISAKDHCFRLNSDFIKFKKDTLQAYNPKNILKRGYALVRSQSLNIVRSVGTLSLESEIKTELTDGVVTSKITKIDTF